jgi:membrane protein DedA with SNARE-associated domain
MDEWLQAVLDYILAHAGGWSGVLIFFSAFLEYIFPPFPGDVITLLAAWLVVKGAWSVWLALTVVSSGALAGVVVDYFIGWKLAGWLGRPGPGRRWLPGPEQLRLFQEKFRRWGWWLIAANRFMPGIRAFFFVAAGSARLALLPVVGLAFVSALAWNGMLLGVGYTLGTNFQRLRSWLAEYNIAAWLVVLVLALTLMVYYIVRRRSKAVARRGQ